MHILEYKVYAQCQKMGEKKILWGFHWPGEDTPKSPAGIMIQASVSRIDQRFVASSARRLCEQSKCTAPLCEWVVNDDKRNPEHDVPAGRKNGSRGFSAGVLNASRREWISHNVRSCPKSHLSVKWTVLLSLGPAPSSQYRSYGFLLGVLLQSIILYKTTEVV